MYSTGNLSFQTNRIPGAFLDHFDKPVCKVEEAIASSIETLHQNDSFLHAYEEVVIQTAATKSVDKHHQLRLHRCAQAPDVRQHYHNHFIPHPVATPTTLDSLDKTWNSAVESFAAFIIAFDHAIINDIKTIEALELQYNQAVSQVAIEYRDETGQQGDYDLVTVGSTETLDQGVHAIDTSAMDHVRFWESFAIKAVAYFCPWGYAAAVSVSDCFRTVRLAAAGGINDCRDSAVDAREQLIQTIRNRIAYHSFQVIAAYQLGIDTISPPVVTVLGFYSDGISRVGEVQHYLSRQWVVYCAVCRRTDSMTRTEHQAYQQATRMHVMAQFNQLLATVDHARAYLLREWAQCMLEASQQ